MISRAALRVQTKSVSCRTIERAIGAYEAVRWPTGKIAGGKG
jgi:hypothetical protein